MSPRTNTRLRPVIRGALIVPLLLASAACASGNRGKSGKSGGAATPRAQRARNDVLMPEEMRRGQWTNAYDLVSNLRPLWLQTRGPDTILGTPTQVQVHLDDARLGGVEALRNLPTTGIAFIQFYDANAAAARWGLNHGQGAIYVSTRPR